MASTASTVPMSPDPPVSEAERRPTLRAVTAEWLARMRDVLEERGTGRLTLGWLAVTTLLDLSKNLKPLLDVAEAIGSGGVNVLLWGSPIALATAYVLLYRWLYRRYVASLSGVRKLLLGVALVVGVAGGFVAYRRYVSPVPDYQSMVRQRTTAWRRAMLGTADPATHGFRTHPVSQSQPQPWTTAQVLVGLLATGAAPAADDLPVVRSAFDYLERTRRPEDGGWGYWDESSWSVTEIRAWVVLAYVASLDGPAVWTDAATRAVVRDRIVGDLDVLAADEHADYGWAPIAVDVPDATRTYSTAMALWAFVEAQRSPDAELAARARRFHPQVRDAIHWLLRTQQPALGWVPNPHREPQTEPFNGLSSQVLYVLGRAEAVHADLADKPTYRAAKAAFLADPTFPTRSLEERDRLCGADQHIRPVLASGVRADVCHCDFLVEASTFLWYPWAFGAVSSLAADATLERAQRERAADVRGQLLARFPAYADHLAAGASETYELAESALGMAGASDGVRR